MTSMYYVKILVRDRKCSQNGERNLKSLIKSSSTYEIMNKGNGMGRILTKLNQWHNIFWQIQSLEKWGNEAKF